jgi:hypothetical protein
VKNGKKIVTYIGQFLIIAIAIIVALRILLWVILALLPSEIAQEAREELGFQSIIKHESQEAAAAYQDHDAVATWILQSLGSPESAQIPTSVTQVLYPFLAPYGGFDKPPISVPPAYVRIGQLSKAILRKRIAIDDRLSKAYTLAQVGALTSILIGLVTTVLVALSSSEVGKQQTRAALTIRIGALVFPALGTAAAAIIAFYDPSGTLARQSQVAAGLQQLHAQMSNAVWSLTPVAKPEDPIPDDFDARLNTWTQRYQELIASIGDSRITSDVQRKSVASPGDSRTASDTPDKPK